MLVTFVVAVAHIRRFRQPHAEPRPWTVICLFRYLHFPRLEFILS